ncbi:MAG TPA: FTR1 family protein [Vicinamibacterales bacterium]
MVEAFVITLREGLEGFLIVAIGVAYLRRTGREMLVPALRWGTLAGVLVSSAGGVLLYRAANQEFLDGPMALIAALSVTWLIVHMWRAGRKMRAGIEGHLQTSAARSGVAAFVSVLLFALFMVSREGMEAALLLIQLRGVPHVFAGAVIGVLGAAILAWIWAAHGRRLNLALLFQVTAIFLGVFVVQLVIQGVHETAEQHFLPYSDIIHTATESWGPDSVFGHFLTYLLAILPMGWVATAWMTGRRVIASR